MGDALRAAAPGRQVQSMPHQRLDRDPSRLTTFPMPGFLASAFQQESDRDNGDSRASPIAADSPPLKKYRPPPMSAGNQYWMPDNLCKVCYDCATAFSLFRRRHHCRLCGQIFCYDCSNNFINGIPHGFTGNIRVCKFCSQYADDAEKKRAAQENEATHTMVRSSDASDGTSGTQASRLEHRPGRADTDVGGQKPSPLVFGPIDDVSTSLLSPLLSPANSNASDPDVPEEQLTLKSHMSTESMDFFDDSESIELQRKFHARVVMPRRRHSSVELLGAIESGGLKEAEIMALNMEKEKASPVRKSSEAVKQAAWGSLRDNSSLHTQHEIALDNYMQEAHEQIREGIKHAVSAISNDLQTVETMNLDHLAVTLEDIAFVVAGHLLFSMNFRSANGFNYANLVKVKSIATAETVQTSVKEKRYNFKWLAGTVCHKHLSHKQMARQISNPRILLFACGISYDRSNGAGKFSSLDTLLEQEKSYMSILVNKISKLEPDVIFVEKTVSRYAQELLRERRIAIVLNVKNELLHRIARHTGAELLTSVDHVDKADPAEVIGRCRSFLVKAVPVAPDDEVAPGRKPLQMLAGVVMGAPVVPNRLRSETYLYMDGCDPLNGCTVLITGQTKAKLRLLKRMTRDVLSMTYRLLLEAHVLSDLDLNKNLFLSKKNTESTEKPRTTWCTTSTLRAREVNSSRPRYHQCIESKHFGITACSDDDISFGNFLNQELAALSLKCQSIKCNYLMADHVHTFSCRTGTVTISFEELPDKNKCSSSLSMSQVSDVGATDKSFGSFSELSIAGKSFSSISEISFAAGNSEREANILPTLPSNPMSQASLGHDETAAAAEKGYPTVIYWRWCRECNGVITPFIPLEKYIYKYSFARFLEVFFSEAEAATPPNLPGSSCPHSALESHVLFFNIGDSVARFDFAKQVSLQLVQANHDGCLKRGDNSHPEKLPWEKVEHDTVQRVMTDRLVDLRDLLGAVVALFCEKVQGIKDAVEAFERCDKGKHARIVLEVMCLSKMVRSGEAVFSQKLAALDEDPAGSVAASDVMQRDLYLLTCRWINYMLKLRKLIKKHLSAEVPPQNSTFTLGGVTFNPSGLSSPIESPRVLEESTLTPSTISREPDWDEDDDRLPRRRSSGTLSSFNGIEPGSPRESVASSSSRFAASDSLKRTSLPTGNTSPDSKAESPRSIWKTALWDLYRVLGRSVQGSDFSVDLPETLTNGHPSLPHRGKEPVYLVNSSAPVTCVAYALATDSYEELLDGWKLRVHREAANLVASRKQNLDGSKPVFTNWSRAALETSLNTPFKYSVMEMPLHLSLLVGNASNSGNSCWEFSTIAYYPLQFDVLRELFYGNLQSFLFSISHVKNWEASGGKSGASFYRTLDDRFVVKHISFTELQSFLGVLPAYFKYMSSIYFEGRPSLLSKTVGLFQTTMTRKDSGQKQVHYICVMENVFYQKQLTRTYDLKGSSRNRFAKPIPVGTPHNAGRVLLDGNFLEFTMGHPVGVFAEGHRFIMQAVENDTAFLYSINIVDYSMVVGLSCGRNELGEEEEEPTEMTVGIIDYLRQFDLIKRVESVGKSVGMIAGQSSPTIIEPGLYGKRFRDAIHRYFMPVTPISSGTNTNK